MTTPGMVPVDPWLSFLDHYKAQVRADPLGIAAYQLFTNLRDAGPKLWLKEALKAIHFSWLSKAGTEVHQLPLKARYDYGFIVDGTAAPGLGTALPVLRVLPQGRHALLFVRDHVLRDPRFVEIANSPNIDVVNIDRTRPAARRLLDAPKAMLGLIRAFPKGLAGIPKLILRKLHVETVLERLLERTNLRWLVTCNERLILSGAAIHAAKRRGIPTACLQHGALVDQYLPVTVDTYLTWGAEANDWFQSRKVQARLCDIGAPRTDVLAQAARPQAPRAPAGARIVVFFTQRPGTDRDPSWTLRVEQEFLSLLEMEDCSLWVKLHPADDPARWEAIAKQKGPRIRLIQGGDPYQVIADADYVGAFYSTVLLEAMLFDKPVFQLNPYGQAVPDYSEKAGCTLIPNGDALKEWIRRCEAGPAHREAALERQRIYARRSFSNFGRASAAFYDCLDSIVSVP